ncbi:hypothetical protein EDC17_103416 [Sphingobacterium alimentarium]|jgi:hypothetical protein|uniref:Uncharacterized protein n=1 Tax=Sphingobacterium alimentarium TaxID=797292 RepID=A0A4R3VU82_9SPHI|nr:hypothetical protein [Sphingobacterium alimentarium]TCV10340.1 hypothetical protein EDC17_103416 [Sphingobacterium alimentarium]
MKLFRILILCVSLAIGSNAVTITEAQAQCAMCSLNAENSTQNGNTQGQGLNDGILFLLAMPFLIGAGVAILWYKKYRHKEEKSPIF